MRGDHGDMGNCYRYCYLLAVMVVGCSQAEPTPTITEPLIIDEPISFDEILKVLPEDSKPYAILFKNMDNPSRSMSQMWVESRGNAYALSPYGGIGLMQFTQPTVETAERSYCAHLGKGDPENPYWSVNCYEAMMTYMDLEPFDNFCDNRKVDECRYNGGWWCWWELKDNNFSFQEAEATCGIEVLSNGRMRSKRACVENYLYSEHINRFQPLFTLMGGEQCN